jgi:hypothetical protein
MIRPRLQILVLLVLFNACASKTITKTNGTQSIIKKNDQKVNIFLELFDSYAQLDTFWENASQNNSPKSYSLENSHLKITTRPHAWDRVKIKTKRNDFGLGTYTWRVYVPKMRIGDKASIGAFVYLDDQHELDFEIGSGKHFFRKKLGAKPDEVLVYCTSQNLPFSSDALLIKDNSWHNLTLQINSDEKGNYNVSWFVDKKLLKTLKLNYGTPHRFSVYCSLENLDFIGNKLPDYPHFTLFDWFKYEPTN